MNQHSHTGRLTDMTERIAQLKRDLAAAQSYATTLAVSMHKQHYAEAAPNWHPTMMLFEMSIWMAPRMRRSP